MKEELEKDEKKDKLGNRKQLKAIFNNVFEEIDSKFTQLLTPLLYS